MNRISKAWGIFLVLIWVDLSSAEPDTNANPYAVIAEKNVFRLTHAPAPPEPYPGPPPTLPKVFLSGFIETGSQWKVLLVVKSKNPDPHGHEFTYYLTLAEGDRTAMDIGSKKEAVVELVKIYPDQEKTEIINSGTPMTLSVEHNGFNDTSVAESLGKGSVVLRRGKAPIPTR